MKVRRFLVYSQHAGTPIEAQLRREGRLKGTLVQPDYNFLDPTLEWHEFLVRRIFYKRNFSPDGIVALLHRADSYLFSHFVAGQGWGWV